ncbi:MAG: PAS domain-containing protein [Alphaproteobacteria bacterium]|nr:PAS domain-containing protein [Alphaproteobacteria bacterium]
MVRTLPGGYCLFTLQGLLREEFGVASRLGVAKVSHFDEIIAALKEGPELIQAFRRLQQTGAEFLLQATVATSGADLQIAGRRFTIGQDGPQVDVLWFCENAAAAKKILQQGALLAQIEGRGRTKQTLLDALPFPLWARAQDLRLVLCNQAYAKAVDSTPADVIRDQTELSSQTARGGSGRALAANAQSRNAPQRERRHVVITGKRRLLEITEFPLLPSTDASKEKTDDGVVMMGFGVDVTAEEEKETELQRHLATHHEVMEHMGSAVAIYGPDTKLEFYNRAYLRLWNAEESFLESKPTFAEVLEDLRTRRRLPEQTDFQRYKNDRLALFTSLLEPREDLMCLPDGTTLRILVAPHPLGGIMFVHENVTDQLALESSYNTLMAVQRETLDNLAEGIAVFGPNGKLRLSNPAFARIWNLEKEYLEKEPHIADLLEQMKPLFNFGDNWAAFKTETVGYTLDRNPRTGRIERADKTVIEFLTVPLPDGAVLNSYLDVSDSVRVEQALRASNAALAAADRLKSDFVANVSYQLRTPLNTITGFAEILAAQYFGTLNEKQTEYAHTIISECEKLARLINDVLDLATIEAGRMALDRHPVVIADLLNAAKRMTAEWARQQALEILIDCPSDLGRFDVDEHRLKQVLFNLIGNAIKYTPAGGRITLEAARQNGWIVLSVRDTGIGIPEIDRERIFGKFERANAQARQSGVGLGLSLVKSLIELHGGRVEILSDTQKGTIVHCFIPVQTATEDSAAAAG